MKTAKITVKKVQTGIVWAFYFLKLSLWCLLIIAERLFSIELLENGANTQASTTIPNRKRL